MEMPSDFHHKVHQVLKNWYTPAVDGPLDTWLMTQKIFDAHKASAPSSPRSHIVVSQGLTWLKEANPDAHAILHRRFIDQETASEIGYSLKVSVDVIYQRQRRAIAQLAQRLWQEEMALRKVRAHHIEARLDAPSYTRLFGVQDKLAQIRQELAKPSAPWFLAFEGMGGIGKTALADALVRELAYTLDFQDIAWISARRRLFRLTGSIEVVDDANLSLAEFVDRLAEQLGLNKLKRQVDQDKFLGVKAYLSSTPCLIVVDNLETARDYAALIPQLRQLAGPSKFIITSRYSLRGESGVYIVPLHGLSPEQTVDFIRYEAGLQGLSDLVRATEADLLAVHEVTGGNPLATKLVIGQAHTFPLPVILERLETCKRGPDGNMMEFIFADAWESLDAKSRGVLQAMLVIADAGGRLEQVVAVANLELNEVMACLRTLARRSLVSVHGDLHERRYRLHPLTQRFVAQQFDV